MQNFPRRSIRLSFVASASPMHLAVICGPQPLLGLHAGDGSLVGSVVHARGECRKSESFWANGKPCEVVETTREGGQEWTISDNRAPRLEREREFGARKALGTR